MAAASLAERAAIGNGKSRDPKRYEKLWQRDRANKITAVIIAKF